MVKKEIKDYPKREGMHKTLLKFESPSGSLKARHLTSKRILRKLENIKLTRKLKRERLEGYKHNEKLRDKRRKNGKIFKKHLKNKIYNELEESSE